MRNEIEKPRMSSRERRYAAALAVVAAAVALSLAYSFDGRRGPIDAQSTLTATDIVATNSLQLNTATGSSLGFFNRSKQLVSYTGSACGGGSAVSSIGSDGKVSCVSTGTSGAITGTINSPNLTKATSSSTVGDYGGSASNTCASGSAATQVIFNSQGSASVACQAVGTVTSTGSAGYISAFASPNVIQNWSGSGCAGGSAIGTISGSGAITCVSAGGTSGAGLYNGTMSTVPTQSGLGFSNWNVPASAAFTDVDQGIELTWPTGSTPSVPGITAVAPATPYTVTATLAYSYTCGANTGNLGCVGWAQGTSGTSGSTKMEALCYVPCGAGGFQQRILDATSSTGGSFIVNQSAAYIRQSGAGIPWFTRIKDDGTTVTFQISFDGIGYTTVYSVAKASGFLGAGGYSRLFFGNWDFNNGPAYVTLLGWKITSP